MPQSLSNLILHLVFSTKERRPFLQKDEDRTAIYRNLCNVSGKLDCPIDRIGGMPDHVHILGRLSRTISVADWVKELKRVSSAEAKTLGPHLEGFGWQGGYGAFSVSQSQYGIADNYVATQEEHHQKQDFKEEFRKLCRKHHVDIDERYVWD